MTEDSDDDDDDDDLPLCISGSCSWQ